MNVWDILIAVCSAGLVLTTLLTLLNKKSQVPRWTSSVPIATLLTAMLPGFFMLELYITTFTLLGQALVWWLIAIFRGIKV